MGSAQLAALAVGAHAAVASDGQGGTRLGAAEITVALLVVVVFVLVITAGLRSGQRPQHTLLRSTDDDDDDDGDADGDIEDEPEASGFSATRAISASCSAPRF